MEIQSKECPAGLALHSCCIVWHIIEREVKKKLPNMPNLFSTVRLLYFLFYTFPLIVKTWHLRNIFFHIFMTFRSGYMWTWPKSHLSRVTVWTRGFSVSRIHNVDRAFPCVTDGFQHLLSYWVTESLWGWNAVFYSLSTEQLEATSVAFFLSWLSLSGHNTCQLMWLGHPT